MTFSKMAHSIKNPDTIHYVVWRTYGGYSPKGKLKRFKNLCYLCMGSCSVTKSKMTRDKTKVTCKNCKLSLAKRTFTKRKSRRQ
jgi:predicted SprT family Zn-dependent metalloprotease